VDCVFKQRPVIVQSSQWTSAVASSETTPGMVGGDPFGICEAFPWGAWIGGSPIPTSQVRMADGPPPRVPHPWRHRGVQLPLQPGRAAVVGVYGFNITYSPLWGVSAFYLAFKKRKFDFFVCAFSLSVYFRILAFDLRIPNFGLRRCPSPNAPVVHQPAAPGDPLQPPPGRSGSRQGSGSPRTFLHNKSMISSTKSQRAWRVKVKIFIVVILPHLWK